ncbi:MAG TPA: hypothetical protein VH438_08150 [Gemmatimonadales bacterium]|jgi:hypothetical protein
MKGIIWLVGGSVGGAVGWWIGAEFGVMTGFILSTVGTGIGVYFAGRLAAEYLP